MKFARFLLSLAATAALIYLLQTGFSVGGSAIPPLGKLLNPFHGFWSNSETQNLNWAKDVTLPGLTAPVQVHYDDRRVPHVIAANNHDLYFMQGYIQARDRLWEMDFITRVASGRISEVFGEKALDYDQTMRRSGIPFAAGNAVSAMESDPEMKETLEAFADGVNTYTQSLSYANYPVEFKLMNYEPEPWTPYKSSLLLKFMSNNLAGRDYDFEYTNMLRILGADLFNDFYPDYAAGIDPIIPAGTPYQFDSVNIDTNEVKIPEGLFTKSPYDGADDENIGSNNWAIAGSRTSTGKPMLSSDPHLRLNLPSIWYEIQLTSPEVNVYGVALPGSPNVIIGFNDQVAWAVTNAGRDVRDWYTVDYVDDTRAEYWFDGVKKPVDYVVETIKIKGQPDVVDTVRYTHYGPVTYDDGFQQYQNPVPLALRWTAHDPSNEIRTFYLLNRAENYDDYIAALNFYECPAQNFAFASQQGDIAMKLQGKFPLKYPDQGKFIQDGSSSEYQWQGYIPYTDNPHHKNPERGFVSSANQHPTDSTYPYYYTGYYEYNRSRRINEILAANSAVTVEDLMKLHNDNYFYTAADILPTLLQQLQRNNLTDAERTMLAELEQWNYHYDAELTAPIMFTLLWENLRNLVWDEFPHADSLGLKAPNDYVTTQLLIEKPAHPYLDIRHTTHQETATDLYNLAFRDAVKAYTDWQNNHAGENQWWQYKNTTVSHWVPLLKPFHRAKLKIGGDKHIVNATDDKSGPSWRMVVSLEDTVKAWGVYPGGQSGNPGSPYYDNFIDTWTKGSYYPLVFIHKNTKPQNFPFSQTFHN